jgi:hypothetical protein
MANDPLAQLFGGPLVGACKVMGVDVKLRTLTVAEMSDALAEWQDVNDIEYRAQQKMTSMVSRSLVEVDGNPLSEVLADRLSLVRSWDQRVLEKLTLAYTQLANKQDQRIDALKNS